MPRWQWLMAQLTRRLWVHATMIGVMGVFAAILALAVDRYLPWKIPGTISANGLESILTIIASSMLAVTTFSLSIMVSAYSAVTASVTPRATKLVIEDRLTQNVLSTFIGSFLFSIVGLVVLKTGAYGPHGRVVLFIFTVIVIVLVVIALMHWIDHITHLGRVGETTDWVEEATRKAISARLAAPYLGGSPLRKMDLLPDEVFHINARTIGYVQHVDMSALSAQCERYDTQIYVRAIPGTFVFTDTPLAWVGISDEEMDADAISQSIRTAFLIGDERSFDQDPRFGLAVLSEIACRALSAAVNDYGTAIDVTGRASRLLCLWGEGQDAKNEAEPKFPRVFVPPLTSADLFEDAFLTMARDGAGLIEVQLRIQKSLCALSRLGDEAFRAAAQEQSALALARAEIALNLEADRTRLRTWVKDAG